jgi:RNAse (barnase) inhibitor barstar
MEFVWIRHEFPWVGYGFVHPANEASSEFLAERLRQLGFSVLELQGSGMATEHELHAELARVFRFPDYYGHNWDAFNECWGEVVHTLPSHVAILWHRADLVAEHLLQPYSETVAMLVECGRFMERNDPPKQLSIFICGEGEQFPSP